ncbi:MAG TPA: response regulator transcription factor [Anaerolineaceae bacterium]|nr:response regulator transcription factor [Anaerolineaceae bacterium]
MNSKILLVDNDVPLLDMLAEHLGRLYRTTTAKSGQEALRKAFSEHPHLVLLEVDLPGMTGWEVIARLREISSIPIMVLTNKAGEAEKLRGFSLGVDDYITKPFSYAELLARINAVLNRTRRGTGTLENIIIVDDLVIDLNRREVRLDSKLVNLTPTEFRLLEILAKRHGKVVTEDDLTKQMWGEYRQEGSTVLRRYVWSLRSKLEEDPANPKWIVTVRGYGYMLE